MPTCVEVGEYFDEIMDALVESGIYSSKAEVVRDALRRLLETIDMRLVGLRAYQRGSTLWRALRISGVGFEEFLSFMLASGVAPEIGCREAPAPPPTSLYVIDPIGVEVLGRLGVLEHLSSRLVLPVELEPIVRRVEALIGVHLDVRFERIAGVRSLVRKLGVTLEEAAVLALAAKHGILAACDPRLGARSGGAGVKRVVCCYALLRLVDESVWRPRFELLPFPVPRMG
ncbi:hypothetical protein Pyrfu_1641 [Pyrolobus fumarii 1A]|uniref:Uncharacterized protein n=1 Tax=Pyrolobus fumarii (strain DSM 11204 / 1A) TaxID=694429 RepID=G0ECC7_PYRF1|nr:type II toxin-antitoxin system ParD family antitoxin [Pyrolobus fumarii]AEM39497.1 hypothetical protein Pyrfu_1641 [Pyrolobus fumarii 1A]